MKTFKFFYEVLEPVSHSFPLEQGEKRDNETALRRFRILNSNNHLVHVPGISSNQKRNIDRRLLAADLLEQLEIDVNKLSFNAIYTLFKSGEIEKTDTDPIINVELRKKVRTLIPHISLFGGIVNTQKIESSVYVSNCYLLCSDLYPDDEHLYPADELVDWVRFTKHELKEIPEDTLVKHYEELIAKAKEKDNKDKNEEEKIIKSKNMIFNVEVIIPGATLVNEYNYMGNNDVELSCLARAFKLFAEKPYLGGKVAHNFGKVKPVMIEPKNVELDDKLYLDFIKSNKKEIVELLMSL